MSDESFILLLSQTVTDELFIGAWKCKSALITRSLFRDAHPAHIQIHKCTHTETLTPSQPLWEAIKYWINMELSVLWWDEVKEFISHARTRTHTHTHTHTHKQACTHRGCAPSTALLIFCLRPRETISTQFTIQQTLICTKRQ